VPEGDSIFRAARTLHRALAGQVVTRFETAYAHLARVDADAPIAGRTVVRCESAGKHLLVIFSGDLVLRTHMRMNGSWHIYRHDDRWWRGPQAMRIRIDTADWVAVAFDVPVAEFVTEREITRSGPIAALGPDLLAGARRGGFLDPPWSGSPAPPLEGGSKDPPLQDPPLQFDREEAVRRLYACGAMPIEQALLDQRVIAGIGNVFKSEVLFVAGVHPQTPASALGDAGLGRIVDIAESLLRMNVGNASTGSITTVRSLKHSIGKAAPEDRLYVYGRTGRPCRKCGTAIMMRKTGSDVRSTYWCPKCQSIGEG
jgi:endonuclease VIII